MTAWLNFITLIGVHRVGRRYPYGPVNLMDFLRG